MVFKLSEVPPLGGLSLRHPPRSKLRRLAVSIATGGLRVLRLVGWISCDL